MSAVPGGGAAAAGGRVGVLPGVYEDDGTGISPGGGGAGVADESEGQPVSAVPLERATERADSRAWLLSAVYYGVQSGPGEDEGVDLFAVPRGAVAAGRVLRELLGEVPGGAPAAVRRAGEDEPGGARGGGRGGGRPVGPRLEAGVRKVRVISPCPRCGVEPRAQRGYCRRCRNAKARETYRAVVGRSACRTYTRRVIRNRRDGLCPWCPEPPLPKLPGRGYCRIHTNAVNRESYARGADAIISAPAASNAPDTTAKATADPATTPTP